MRIGVFVCECGGNISTNIDVNELCSKAQTMPGVVLTAHVPFLCAKPGVEVLKNSIVEEILDRVVISACSPNMHEAIFRESVSEAGLNPFLTECVNIREQCSWVHGLREEATKKAVDLLRGGVYRACTLRPIETKRQKVSPSALVIGGGIAGITCALGVAESGYHVLLVERSPSIGGHMAQLSKTFPTLDCAPCILGPRMTEVERHEKITLVTNAIVQSVTGQVGRFHINVRRNPRGVSSERCVSCGKCSEKCPVTVLSEFELGLNNRKAIYKPFPEAVPGYYVIDYSVCKQCGLCIKACPTGAIDLRHEVTISEHDIGVIILTTGFDLIDMSPWKNFQTSKNILTALQMERLIIRDLASGKILRREDGQRVRRIAYVLCAGSRDPHKGVPYCSNICCAYSIKQAIILKKTMPYLQVWLYYTDMRMTGRGLEEFYSEARELHIRFIHGKPDGVTLTSTGEIILVAEDKDSGLLMENNVDLVVLATAMVPSRDTSELVKILGINLGEDGFIAEKHPKMEPIATQRAGIFAAGAALGPKDVKNSVTDGQAAAGEAVALLNRGEIPTKPVRAVLSPDLCNECGICVKCCPDQAITLTLGKVTVEQTSCSGCGICAGVCPSNALEVTLYGRKQLMEQIKGLLKDGSEEIRVVGFFGDEVAYRALDAAGTARLTYSSNIRVVRVPTTGVVNEKIVMYAFASGADGVILFDTDGSAQAIVTDKMLQELRPVLEEFEARERVLFQPILLPLYRVIGQQIDGYVKKIKNIGKMERKIRQKIATLVEEQMIT